MAKRTSKTRARKGTVRLMKTIAEIYRDKGKQLRFRLKARNGEIIAVSESYTRLSSVVRGARRAYPQATLKMAL